jgi:hypothetical protein
MAPSRAFPKGCSVRLSEEGKARLLPARQLRGEVLGDEAGLVIVQDENGKTADYHPDFLEVVHVPKPPKLDKPRPVNRDPRVGRAGVSV